MQVSYHHIQITRVVFVFYALQWDGIVVIVLVRWTSFFEIFIAQILLLMSLDLILIVAVFVDAAAAAAVVVCVVNNCIQSVLKREKPTSLTHEVT